MDHVQTYLQGKMGERYQEAKELFLEGHSLSKIQEMTGYNRKWLSQLLKAEGYVIKQNNKKHDYNEAIFELIDNEEKAYWLGFLYADGCVTVIGIKSVKISLQAEDEEHLAKFRDFICPTLPIVPYWARIKKIEKQYNSVRVTATNSKIVDDLIALGCYPDKTEVIDFPFDKVPFELLRHFIRGYFDGDGSVAKTNGVPSIRFLGASRSFVSDIQERLCDETGVSKNKISDIKREGRKVLYQFQNGSRKDVEALYNYFYEDANIYLPRKKDIIKNRLDL